MTAPNHYYTVGVHGPPTKETAPHGFRFKYPSDHYWHFEYADDPDRTSCPGSDMKWQPLPAPPVEQAPAPEPVARWEGLLAADCVHGILRLRSMDVPAIDEVRDAADALNTLDRDGVCYGPGRPMSELPVTGRVLTLDRAGNFLTWDVGLTRRHLSVCRCWWPLPESGE